MLECRDLSIWQRGDMNRYMRKKYSKPAPGFLATRISGRIAGTCFGTSNTSDTLRVRYNSGTPVTFTERNSWEDCDSTMPKDIHDQINVAFGIAVDADLFGPNTTDSDAYSLDFEPFNS